MNETHISYKFAKALKEFLGVSAPEPMAKEYYYYAPIAKDYVTYSPAEGPEDDEPAAYQLHDLLSKPFCEAFVKVGKVKFGFDEDEVTDFIADWSTEIGYAYWNGGLPAVETELMKMMEAK